MSTLLILLQLTEITYVVEFSFVSEHLSGVVALAISTLPSMLEALIMRSSKGLDISSLCWLHRQMNWIM